MSVFWLIKLVNAFVSTCISDKNECKFKQLLLRVSIVSYCLDPNCQQYGSRRLQNYQLIILARPVLWSQETKTIKLIYAIQDITLMVISNISGTWSSGHNRTFRGSDPDDVNGEVRANGNAPCVIEVNAPCVIEGDDNYMITGDADAFGYCNFGDGP
jgi:hypothetical protein